MKLSKILYKASLVLVSLSVVCLAVPAFAYTGINTSTTYNVNSGEIAVTTNVTGVGAAEQVTYMAYEEGKTPASSTIAYIDQDSSATGTVTFDYVVDITQVRDINNIKFKVGSNVSSVSAEQSYGSYDVTVNVTGVAIPSAGITVADYNNSTVINSKSITTSGEVFTVGTTNSVKFSVPAGYTATITCGEDTIAVDSAYTFSTDATVNIVLAEASNDPYIGTTGTTDATIVVPTSRTIDTVWTDITTDEAATIAENFIVAISSINNYDNTVSEYGIAASVNAADFTVSEGVVTGVNSEVTFYAALDKNADGAFAIKLQDGGSGALSYSNYYVVPYAIINGSTVYGGALTTISID